MSLSGVELKAKATTGCLSWQGVDVAEGEEWVFPGPCRSKKVKESRRMIRLSRKGEEDDDAV
jgi:hypothetical protein